MSRIAKALAAGAVAFGAQATAADLSAPLGWVRCTVAGIVAGAVVFYVPNGA